MLGGADLNKGICVEESES